ncbi:MAG TPA: hypothetical protein VK277_03060 [Acidimicrobiales bacterium]|nr:hypothetical protein [Acidimicrobiales bacterium]
MSTRSLIRIGYFPLGDDSVVNNTNVFDIVLTNGYALQAANAGSGTLDNTVSGTIDDTSTSSHSISVPFLNAGLLLLQTGVPLNVTGLQFASSSTLQVTLDSASSAGKIVTSGSETVNGDLLVTNGGSFIPTSGTQYTIVQCLACSGAFVNVYGPVTDTVNSSSVVVTTGTQGPAFTQFKKPNVYPGKDVTFKLKGTGLSASDTASVVGPGTGVTATLVSGSGKTLAVAVTTTKTTTPGVWLL